MTDAESRELNPVEWLVVSLAARDGSAADTSTACLSSILGPVAGSQVSVVIVARHWSADGNVALSMAPCLHGPNVRFEGPALLPGAPLPEPKDISDEEHVLHLWELCVAHLWRAGPAAGLVVALTHVIDWKLLERRLSVLITAGSSRCVRVRLLVGVADPGAAPSLDPICAWEKRIKSASGCCALDVSAVRVCRSSAHVGREAPPAVLPTALGAGEDTSPDGPGQPPLLSESTVQQFLSLVAASPSRVVLVEGPTGCGKSTKLPAAIADADAAHVVWIAQPRRVAAVALCQRVNDERGSSLDADFAVGGVRGLDAARARLTFMTSGVMLQRVKAAFRSGSYLCGQRVTHIVLDEIHERTVEYDLLLVLLRELLRHHPSLRLVLMSATMSTGVLQEYMALPHIVKAAAPWPPTPPLTSSPQAGSDRVLFRDLAFGSSSQRHATDHLVPVLRIPVHSTGRFRRTSYLEDMLLCLGAHAAPVAFEDVFGGDAPPTLPFSVASVLSRPSHKDSLLWEARLQLLTRFIAHLHATRPIEEAVLVFLPGMSHQELVEEALRLGPRGEQLHCVLVHSSNDAENELMFKAPPRGQRKVLLATNIAESSITIPTVDHVVDTCIVKDQRYLHEEGVSMLEERYCSKDSCEQRAGRTGRVRVGSVWRLVTRAEYDALPEGRTPGILQAPLTSTVLLAADSNVGQLETFLLSLPTPPVFSSVVKALHELRGHYDALVSVSSATSLGHQRATAAVLQPSLKGTIMTALGVSVPVAQLVLLGVMCGIPVASAQAAALLSATSGILQDEASYVLADFDSGTGCDVIASVELMRWAARRHESAYAPNRAPASVFVDQHIRQHVCNEVRIKTEDLLSALAEFGLYSPAAVILRRDEKRAGAHHSQRWRETSHIQPLTAEETLRLVAVLAAAFVSRTLIGNDAGARYRPSPASRRQRSSEEVSPSRALYTPSHRVTVIQRSAITADSESAIKAFVSPAQCSLRRTSDVRLVVDIALERALDTDGRISDRSFVPRNVRNVTFDAYRLMRVGRKARKALNIAYADTADDVHALSSWFTECRPSVFIDRSCILYPLVLDMTAVRPPAVVACGTLRRTSSVAVTNAVYLPGDLSLLPLALAPAVHWDGRSMDERSCYELPTLPHCHPSTKHLRQFAPCLVEDIASLNEAFRQFLPTVSGFIALQEYQEAHDVVSGFSHVNDTGARTAAEDVIFNKFLAEAWHRAQLLIRTRVLPHLDRMLVLYLDHVPLYYAPQHVRAFVSHHATLLPLELQTSLPHVREALLMQHQCGSSASAADVDCSANHAVVGTLLPADTEVVCRDVVLASQRSHRDLLLLTDCRALLSVRQLLSYRRHVADRHQATSAQHAELSAVFSVGSGAADESEWMSVLAFPKRYARSIPMVETCAVVAQHLKQQLASLSVTAVASMVDVTAAFTGGVLPFRVVVDLLDTIAVRELLLVADETWLCDLARTNVHAAITHVHPVFQQLVRWRCRLACSMSTLIPSRPEVSDGMLLPSAAVWIAYVPPRATLLAADVNALHLRSLRYAIELLETISLCQGKHIGCFLCESQDATILQERASLLLPKLRMSLSVPLPSRPLLPELELLLFTHA